MNTNTNIYDLLGIQPNASASVARELYWRRVDRYVQAERNGDGSARAAIDDLNHALAIIMDADLRAQYDRQWVDAGKVGTPPDGSPPSGSRLRGALVTTALLLTLLMAVAVAVRLGPVTAVAVVVAGVLTAAWVSRRRGRAGHVVDPRVTLQVHRDATLDEMRAAYEIIAGELLSHVGMDPGALRRLDALDDAYRRATAEELLRAIEEDGGDRRAPVAPGVSPGAAGPARSTATRTHRPARAAGEGIAPLASGARKGGTALARGIGAGGTSVGRLFWGWANGAWAWSWHQASQMSRSGDLRMEAASSSPELAHRVRQRLTSSLRDASERVALVDLEGETSPSRPAVMASLFLASQANARRIPVGPTPLRIGSGPDCDMVLNSDDIAEEHVHVWLRGDVLLLHRIAPEGVCLVNGAPMTWATLDHGDRLRLGDSEILVELQR